MKKISLVSLFCFSLVITGITQGGSLDTLFGENGFTVWDNNGNTDAFYSMTQSSDGKIFLSGYTANGNNETPAIIQLDPNGKRNNAFGNEGMVALEPTATSGETADIAIYGESIYVAYYATIDENFSGAITKYDLSGIPDSSFGETGKKTISYNAQSYTPKSIAIDDQENIYVLAIRGAGFIVMKMDKNGVADQPYGDNGVFFYEFDQGFANLEDISLLADGLILITGQHFISSSTDPEAPLVVFRLNTSGNLDETFHQTGFRSIELGEDILLSAYKIFWSEQEEKLIIIGSYYSDNHDGLVMRLNPDGSDDDSFGNSGVVLIEEIRQPLYDGFRDLEGRIVVAGDDYIIRLTATGEKDNSFGTNGIVSDQYNIYACDMDATGNYLVTGSSYNGNDLDGFVSKYLAEDMSSSTEDIDHQLLNVESTPNPFVDYINVSIYNKNDLPSARIVIQNQIGQVVYRSPSFHLNFGINHISINEKLSTLEPQTYILSVVTGKGVTSKKVIKL
ncbi:MAG: hypothetical protein HKN68_13235 [Saprospiraceae bacterium]|nr:hypothetical protein [Saprospiraceae bacterium]